MYCLEKKHKEEACSLNYINREISWLQFNRRVLEEAQDESTPLLERTKFLSIVSTNLDEFVSVRVAGLMDKIRAGNTEIDFTGFTPQQLQDKVIIMIEQLVADQYATYARIIQLLNEEGLIFTAYGELTPAQRREMETYYLEKVFPVLTPLAIDKSRPFPLIRSKSVYLAVALKSPSDAAGKEAYIALVEIPSNLPRYIEVPSRLDQERRQFILLEDLIKQHIHTLFTTYTPLTFHTFRLTRNADLDLNEEEAEDILDEVEKVLRARKWGTPVRLEIENGFDPFALELLEKELELESQFLITNEGPIDLSYFMSFANSIEGYEHLKYSKFDPLYPWEFIKTDDIFSVLRGKDVLLFHPYESFDTVNDFVQHAAADPSVMAIKMTLYRVNGNSQIIRSLNRAAEAGKQVTVVVELKARFDEAKNIEWAKELEKSGCHVVYGLSGLKIHAKMILVVRKEADSLRRYIHVATGNYNEVSAQVFTDIGLFSSHPEIGEDVSNLFNKITGFSAPNQWHYLSVAPVHLKQRLLGYIQREVENALRGRPARIIAKMNSLSNKQLVDELYAASQAGVRIDLIVRGICCLRPGIPGLSDNITVRSIVGRFLEHSRIFYFENAGIPQVWLSSADWMTRNMDKRIELMCPVLNEEHQSFVIQYLLLLLSDNIKARQLLSNGQYVMAHNEQPPCHSQSEAKNLIVRKNNSFPVQNDGIIPLVALVNTNGSDLIQ
ncbi:polyphosphate kinase 1 [Paenibacillus sp. CMAA1739]|uniref:polyphosphate kinase 1 n=1 Tax=Paenibacillus ottowii TaxID=2315729 RepID=UPI002DB729AC|nr:polyphosphate kinase 1 [Paenibacillus sp. CMAA1739]MEC4568724.1 polyphosphate kinase 1 [Paenibacillus sp. CMAA1739]